MSCLGLGDKLFIISAVYTGIKKPESFSHSGFSLKVARQLPLNTPKTHLRSMIFWNSVKISLFFCQCKRSLQSHRYYSGFWSRGTWPSAESPDRGPRRNAHYTCTVKGREKSRMRTTYQNTSMRFRFFRACAFRAKTPECYMGFSWQWILVFANVGPIVEAHFGIGCLAARRQKFTACSFVCSLFHFNNKSVHAI